MLGMRFLSQNQHDEPPREHMNKNISTLLLALTLTTTGTWAAEGEETFKTVCATCHAQGLAKAPKLGDAKAWAKLIKEGQINLTADGYMGVRGMPARGGKADLTVTDFSKAVVYMANQSGGNWQMPDEAMLRKINERIDKRQAAKK